MAKQKPPDPNGKTTGFPYQLLWEQFAPQWERLTQFDASSPVDDFRSMLGKLDDPGRFDRRLERTKIAELIESHIPHINDREALIDRLEELGAAFLRPAIHRELGHTPKRAKRALEVMARRARALRASLDTIDENVLRILLSHYFLTYRSQGEDPDRGEYIIQPVAIDEVRLFLEDLVNGASVFAHEMPIPTVGASRNMLQRRFVCEVAEALQDAGAGHAAFFQADSSGRRYRPDSPAAWLLTGYLKMVDSSLTLKSVFGILDDEGFEPSRHSPAARSERPVR